MSKDIDGELTNRQLAFIDNYMVHFNAARAAREAGFSKTSSVIYCYELLRHPLIKAELERRAKAYGDARMGLKNRVVEELTNIAFASLDDVGRFGPSGLELKDNDEIPDSTKRAIAEFTVNETDKGVNAKVRFHNKTQALEILAKHLAMFKDQEVQINVKPYIIRRRNGEEIEMGLSNGDSSQEQD